MLGESKKALVGGSIFDSIKSGVNSAYNSTIGSLLSPSEEYNNVSKKTISEYGNQYITGLKIYRTPLQSFINIGLNAISFGQWGSIQKKYGYDKLFHLALVCTMESGKEIIVEKLEAVNVSTSYATNANTEILVVPLGSVHKTLNEVLNYTQQRMGKQKFFLYNSLNNNCQVFVIQILAAMGLSNDATMKFVYQDFSKIEKELPSYVKSTMNAVTNLGATVNKLTGGKCSLCGQCICTK